MRIAYFDCIAGASGDMILGALVAAGVPLEYLQQTAAALQISGLSLSAMPVKRNEISAIKVQVSFPSEKKHRHLYHINAIIDGAALPQEVKRAASNVFQRLAMAEAKVHNTTLERIHFHEVGAVDAIADVVCSVAGLHHLQVEKNLVSKFPLGGGMVKCEHGVIPVPAPATAELIQGFPAHTGPVDFELLTPTGAAILTTLAQPDDQRDFKIHKIGYGAGGRDFQDLPNVLRLFVGETTTNEHSDSVTMIETNIDDMNPEIYPFVIERLLENGALDAFLCPIIMKKGRPGVMLSVLSPADTIEDLLGIIYAETTTLGVRLLPVGRRKLKRWQEKHKTDLGEILVKVAEWRDKKFFAPEFEECKRLAREQQLPLREVYERIRQELCTIVK
ncbi:MAG: nickel pincer cofactor biosynthesis protein LarC [bacterium]